MNDRSSPARHERQGCVVSRPSGHTAMMCRDARQCVLNSCLVNVQRRVCDLGISPRLPPLWPT